MECVQAVVRKKNFWIQLEDDQIKYMITCYFPVISSKKEVDQGGEDSILELPKKVEGWLFNIDGHTNVE